MQSERLDYVEQDCKTASRKTNLALCKVQRVCTVVVQSDPFSDSVTKWWSVASFKYRSLNDKTLLAAGEAGGGGVRHRAGQLDTFE